MVIARVLVRGVSSEYVEWIPDLWLALLGSALLGALFIGFLSPLPRRIRNLTHDYALSRQWARNLKAARVLLGSLPVMPPGRGTGNLL